MKISLFSSPPGQIRHVFSLTMLFSVFILLLPDARAMDNSRFGLHPEASSEQPEEGTFTFQVYLKDSDMNLLSGGSLRFHDGAWHTVSETSTGTFEVNTNTASVTLEMTYNNGRQTVGGHASADDFTYQTTTATLAIRDSDEALQSGGTGRYHQIGWVNWNSAANTDIELLPGQYTFEATINNGRQTKVLTVPAGAAYEAGFHTVTTTLAIKDSDGATLPGGTGRYHQITWANWNSEANTAIELLPGQYTFEATINNGRQTKVLSVPDGDPAFEATFTTVTTTLAIKDSDGVPQSGGTGRYHQITWANWNSEANTEIELLPGQYTFEATINNGRQTKVLSVPNGDPAFEATFTTVTTTLAIKDSDGVPQSGGTGRYHQITWANWNSEANTEIELLPGQYTFEATINNSRQTKVIAVPADPAFEATFNTVTTTVNLSNCVSGLDGALVKYHQLSWQDFGTTDANGNAVRELLPGQFTFEINYNGGKQTTVFVVTQMAATQLSYNATLVKLQYSGVIQYYQNGWHTFTQPAQNMLEGAYIFRFDGYQQNGVTISGCDIENTIVIYKMQKCNGAGVAGGTGYLWNNGWLTASATAANGVLIAWFNGTLTGNRRMMMSYNNTYSAELNQNISANSVAVFNLADVDIRAWDGSSVVSQADGGDLATVYIWNNGWKSLEPNTQLDANGILNTYLFPGNRRLLMSGYNYSSLDITFPVSGCDYNADFPTVRNAVTIRDQSHTLLSGNDPNGVLYIWDNGWKALGTDLSTDGSLNGTFKVAVLAGNRRFLAQLNNTSIDKTFPLAIGDPVASFNAIRNPVKWLDQNHYAGAGDPNATVYIWDNGWKFLGEDDDDSTVDGVITMNGQTNENSVILEGNRRFLMQLNHTAIDKTFNLTQGGAEQACFNALRNPVKWEDQCDGTGTAGDPNATVFIWDNGWHFLGEDDDDGNDVDGEITYNGQTSENSVILEGNRRFLMQLNHSAIDKTFALAQGGVEQASFNTVRNPVEFRDQFGDLLPDSEGAQSVHIWDNGWHSLGTTNNGTLETVVLEGNRRFLGQLNHSAIDKTFNLQQTGGAGLCGADVAVFEAVKDAVRLLNGCDGGIAGGVARIWDNGWQLLGTTDASGIVKNQSLLSGNRRILMTLPNGDARDQTFAINWTPAYAVFNASNVSFHYCGNVEYKKGNQWLPLSNPTSLFQGSVQFRFDGIIKTIDLTGACNIDQTLVVFNLLNSGGGGQSGGNAQINAGGWKQADDQTDANGRLLAFFNGSLLGNRQLRMTYWAGDPGFLSTSASQTVNIGNTCNVTFQLADAHFRSWDGSSVVTEADGGDPNANVCVNSGGYKQLGILGSDGELHVDMFANNHQFKMGNYNYTSQVLTQNLNSNNVVDFGTRTMAIELRDENGNLVTSHDGTAYINSGGYKNLGTTAGAGIVDIALLYGNWQFKMEMNYSSQVKTVNITGGPAVMDARILPVQVLDENHMAVENVTVCINSGGYKSLGETNALGFITTPLMLGNWQFKGSINYTSQVKTANISGGPAILDARSIPVVAQDVNSAPVEGVVVCVNSGGYKGIGATDANGEIHTVLMLGNWQFKGSINYTSQVKTANISGGPAILDARSTPVVVQDENSAPVEGVVVCVNSGGYKGIGATDANGEIHTVLMLGNWQFKGSINYTSQVKTVNISGGPAILDARTDAVRLENQDGNGLANGMGYVNSGGYKLLGATDGSGFIPNKPLMLGNYQFKMNYTDPNTNDNFSEVKTFNISGGPVVFVYNEPAPRDAGTDIDPVSNIALETAGNPATGDLSVYPNPARESAEVEFEVFQDTRIQLSLFDAKGALVRMLTDGEILKGQHRFTVERPDLSGGIYYIRLISAEGTVTKRIVFME